MGRREEQELKSLRLQYLIKGVVSTLFYMMFSSGVIIYNKTLFDLGFKFPLAVTGMGQLFSAFGGLAMSGMGLMPIGPVPSRRAFMSTVLPVVLCFTASLFFGNYAYLRLSVSFVQILKAFTPAVTLLMCLWAGMEHWRMPLALSVVMITVGTGSAVMIEGTTDRFHMIGFLSFVASSLTEAARTVLSEKLLGAHKYNTAQALVYIGGPTAAVLLGCSVIWEGPGMYEVAWPLVLQHHQRFLLAFGLSFLVNLSCYFTLKYTSSLTFKVVGCIKNIGVILFGVLFFGDHVSALQILGYLVSILGFIWYSRVRQQAAQQQQPKLRRKTE